MPDAPIHCVFSVDGRFSQHLCVTLASLLLNNRESAFVVHVVHENVPKNDLEIVKAFIGTFSNAQLVLYTFNSEPYRDFRLDKHISIASYFRVFLPSILPANVDRVLYLDSDLVVRSDLTDLLSLDLGGAYLAAAPNLFSPGNAPRLGLPPGSFYFNAGVLLINLAFWRETNVTARLVDYIKRKAPILQFHDQDALNAVMHGSVRKIDYSWNFQARTRPEDLPVVGRNPAEFKQFAASARIIHFTTAHKPWHYMHDVQFKDEYDKYLALTPFRSYSPPDRTFYNVVKKQVYKRPNLLKGAQLLKRVFR